MRPILLAFVLLFSGIAGAQSFQPRSGLCMNPSGAWIPINASILGTATQTYQPINLFGENSNGQWYGLACDTSGNLITSSATSIAYNPTNAFYFGDSITACVGVTTATNCYPQRISALLNIVFPAYNALQGDQACDVPQLQQFGHDNPTPVANQPWRSVLIGTNDANVKGAGGSAPVVGYESTFNTCDQAIMSWAGVPSNFKALGSTATAAGTCSNDTTFTGATGEKCTASGSTITFSGFATTGGPIYIWPRFIDSDTGTWTYAVDGGSPVSVTTALSPAIATQNGGTQSVGLIRIPVSAGTHSVVLTQTNNGTMSVIAIGTPPNTALSGTPYLVVGQIPNQLNGNLQAAVNDYRTQVLNNFNLLKGDGLNLLWAPVDQYLQATTAAADMFNTLHPNDIGHAELEAAFLSAIHVSTPTGSYLNVTPFKFAQNAPQFFPQSITAGPYAYYFDDFFTQANKTAASIGSPTAPSCGSSTTFQDDTSPGNLSIVSGTGSSGSGQACSNLGGIASLSNPSTCTAANNCSFKTESRVIVPVLPGTTLGSYQTGLVNIPIASPWTSGIGFWLSNANAVPNDWYCRFSSTSIDSGIVANTAWTRLSIWDDGTNVHWYVNGVEATACKTAIGSMPTSSLFLSVTSTVGTTGTSVTLGLDYWMFQMNLAR